MISNVTANCCVTCTDWDCPGHSIACPEYIEWLRRSQDDFDPWFNGGDGDDE